VKKYLLITFLIGWLIESHTMAQTRELDSIRNEVDKHPQHDTTRLNLLVEYLMHSINTNTSQALPLMREVVTLSREINNTRGVQVGYIYLQIYYSDRGDFPLYNVYADTALYYLQSDTSRFARVNMAYLYNNLGGDNYKIGDYQKAADQYTQAAAILEKYHKMEALASVYGGLATVYGELAQFEKAFEYDHKAIEAAEKSGSKALIGRRQMNYADRLVNRKKFEEAETILKKAEPLVNETKDAIAQALFYQVRGAIYQHKKQYAQAIADFRKPYAMSLDNDDKYQQVALLDPLVKLLIDAGQLREAKQMNDTLLDKSIRYQINFGRKNAYENYARWYRLNHDYARAYQFLEKRMLLTDSISSDETKKKIAMTEVRYRVAVKDREIKSLQEEKELHELQIKQKNILNYILIGSTISFLLISLLIYRNYQHRQKLQQQRINELETEKQLTATEAILRGEEQERSRLAKDLHDGLGGMLSGIKYALNNMKENMIMAPADVQAFEHSIHMLDSSISEMRRVAHNLMPESLLKFGLNDALHDFCKEMSGNGMLKVAYHSFGLKDKSIDRGLSVTTYRIVQELLNNIIKHAAATQAIVQISVSESQLTITVEDDGKGMAPDALKISPGIGWKNIRSRVDYHKGTLQMESTPGKGTSVFIEFPLR
jgi:signal transduction histidine kinase